MATRRALVTGVGRGLGRYLAGRLLDDGWEVVGVGRRAAGEPDLTDRGMTYLRCDLAVAAQVDALVPQVGPLDLVAHAAVDPADHADHTEPGVISLERVFAVNAFAPYRLTAGLLERAPADRFCAHVLVNSEVVYHADRSTGPRAASKAALGVFAMALAESCRGRAASVSTLVLGPLRDQPKVDELTGIAERRGLDPAEVVARFLRRSNPDLVIDELIDHETCYTSLGYVAGIGSAANGMVVRLDGGSAGSVL